MQTYDMIMLAVVGAAMAFGFIRGLAWQAASLGSLVLSYFVAFNLRTPVAAAIDATPPWNMFLAMFVLFIGTWIAVWVGFRFVKASIESMKLKDFDRQAGALLGAVKGSVVCLLITFFAVTLLGERQRAAVCNSYSGRYIAQLLDHADAVMPAELHAHLDPFLNRLEEELDQEYPGYDSADEEGGGWAPDFRLPDSDSDSERNFSSDRFFGSRSGRAGDSAEGGAGQEDSLGRGLEGLLENGLFGSGEEGPQEDEFLDRERAARTVLDALDERWRSR